MKIKSWLNFEVKSIAEDGTFEGMLSPYGNVDHGADVVEAGAFTKTLKEHGSTLPLLWFHQQDMPIGELELEDRADGLWCKGRLMMDLPKAKEAYLLLKSRIVKGLSIGFKSVKDSVVSGVRHLKEIRLFEGSVVMFPMNDRALVANVKSRSGDVETKDFVSELAQVQTLDSLWQILSAFNTAINDAIWSDLARADKITAAETAIEQFAEALISMFPGYLDALGEAYGLQPTENWSRGRLEAKVAAICRSDKHPLREKILALVGGEAAAGTSETKAAEPPEPVADHSGILKEISALIPA